MGLKKKNSTKKISFDNVKEYLPLIILLLVTGFLFLIRLGRNTFSDWDECLYAQYAKEIPLVKHYIANIWNGYVDMQKPPLYSWILIWISKILWLGEFPLRLMSALSGLCIVASVYLFCKRYFSLLTAVLASIILMTGELFVIYSLRLNTDILYTLFIFLAFWLWLLSDKKHHFAYFAGLLFGISTLLKGLGSMQFIGTILIITIIYPSKDRFVRFIKMSLIYFFTILPWHILAFARYGNKFINVYYFDNIVKRGTYPIEFHRERWWFYFVLLFRELKPWIFAGLLYPVFFIYSVIKQRTVPKILSFIQKEHLVISILMMILVPLAFLVKYQTRIAWYALPFYPFIAIFLAYCIEKLIILSTNIIKNQKSKKIIVFFLSAIVILFIITDSLKLLINETKILQDKQILTTRENVIFESRKYSQKHLYYLVPFWERQAREILPPTEQIDMTWVYGGNPCAVYYSNKKVRYFYFVDDFIKELGKKNILYLSHVNDKSIFESTKPIIIYSNSEYILFTY